MPVGGLFCGTVYLGGDGRLWLWDIFNRNALGIEPNGGVFQGADQGPITGSSYIWPLLAAKYRPLEQGFSLVVKSKDGEVRRTLDTDPTTGFAEVSFTGQYPVGTIRYRDPKIPITVKLEAFSPFIPLDVADSSLPLTVFRFELTNTGGEAAEVTLEGVLENAVFHGHRYLDGTRRTTIRRDKGASIVELTAELAPSNNQPREDILFEDWSKPTYADAGWAVEGEAFGPRPVARAALPPYMGDVGGDTDFVANSHAGNSIEGINQRDDATGKLTSRPFKIERKFIKYWLGGGCSPENLAIRVVVDGKIVASASGGRANKMAEGSLAVAQWQGREAHIEIVDQQSGPWGNIGVGRIVMSDRLPVQLARLPDAGSMALALLGPPAELFSPDSSASLAEKLTGKLGRRLSLEPGQSAVVSFIVAWHFPNAPDLPVKLPDEKTELVHAYAKRFPDAGAVARFAVANFDRLSTQTLLWRDTWYDSTLPWWFLNRTMANTSTLATTVCALLNDGRLHAYEGVGCCPGTCTHVWHYAQALARLFPEIERNHREFVDFQRALQADGTVSFRGECMNWYAVDGQAGRILGVYREDLMSTDDQFLRRVWPATKKALEKIIATDGNDGAADGIIRGPLHNTLDADWQGVVPWLCGMYHAALRAGEEMAQRTGDDAFANKCRAILDRASRNLDELCWNNDYGYYVHVGTPPEKSTEVGAYEGCHIDQVLGQAWAWQVGLGEVMTRDKVRRALESLWKYNSTPDVGPFRAARKAGRWYALPGDGGLIMLSNPFAPDITFTGASAGTAQYFNECMSGFEHQVAAHMMWENMVTESLAITRAIHDRYHPRLRNPYNEIECSDHYARAMASYGTFLAACGFEYDGPKGHIGFAPRLTPDDFRAPFVAAEGWGTYWQKRGPKNAEFGIQLRWGKLRLKTMSLELAEGLSGSTAKVTLGRKPVRAELKVADRRALITFAEEIQLTTENELHITIN